MLFYPKIPALGRGPLSACYAFEKYDGTNFHWDWEPEVGWKSFGTRRDQFAFNQSGRAEFTAAHPGLEEAPEVFLATLAEPLARLFHSHPDYQDQKIFAYAEFLGANFQLFQLPCPMARLQVGIASWLRPSDHSHPHDRQLAVSARQLPVCANFHKREMPPVPHAFPVARVSAEASVISIFYHLLPAFRSSPISAL